MVSHDYVRIAALHLLDAVAVAAAAATDECIEFDSKKCVSLILQSSHSLRERPPPLAASCDLQYGLSVGTVEDNCRCPSRRRRPLGPHPRLIIITPRLSQTGGQSSAVGRRVECAGGQPDGLFAAARRRRQNKSRKNAGSGSSRPGKRREVIA
jgi:hypothetical protein